MKRKKLFTTAICAMTLCASIIAPSTAAKADVAVQTDIKVTKNGAILQARKWEGMSGEAIRNQLGGDAKFPTSSAWCASFVSKCLGIDVTFYSGESNLNRKSTDICKKYFKLSKDENCVRYIRIAERSIMDEDDSAYYNPNYQPERGDLVFFMENSDGEIHHIGIVDKVDDSGSLWIYEGNAVEWQSSEDRRRGECSQSDFDDYNNREFPNYPNRVVAYNDLGTKDRALKKGSLIYGYAKPKYLAEQPGDVDGDGKVGLTDVATLKQYVGKVITEKDLVIENADYNRDGIVDITDMTAICVKVVNRR